MGYDVANMPIIARPKNTSITRYRAGSWRAWIMSMATILLKLKLKYIGAVEIGFIQNDLQLGQHVGNSRRYYYLSGIPRRAIDP